MVDAGNNREERISNFNRIASETQVKKHNGFVYTSDFERKQKGGSQLLPMLRSISFSDLQVGKTHRECAVYCRIATKVLKLTSAMVLVEDENGDIAELAVYGNVDVREFKEGRRIAIKEPFYKIRSDGSEGIRVDDPSDIIFDPRGSVEDRLSELVLQDRDKGIDKLYSQLFREGFGKVKKQRIRALKRTLTAKDSSRSDNSNLVSDEGGNGFVSNTSCEVKKNVFPKQSILSLRNPNLHCVIKNQVALKCKKDGNDCLLKKEYSKAEKLYTEVIKNTGARNDDTVEDIYLWQLYSNRAAARMQMGKLQEALQDSLEANKCAPEDEIKPVLRCSETLVALGLREEASNLLQDAVMHFTDKSEVFQDKLKRSVIPTKVIRVGKNHEFTKISDAIIVAPAGTEIVVDPGNYRENLYINKPVTIRCNQYKSCNAIESFECCDTDFSNWVEINSIDGHAIYVESKERKPVHLIGLKISCESSSNVYCYHTIYAVKGTLVIRDCICTSSSGPVVVARFQDTQMILQSSVIHESKQGGALVVDCAHMAMHNVHCCHNAAMGLELRDEGSAEVKNCQFYKNGRQGVMVWKNAGYFEAYKCKIHSHPSESGVLVCEANATLRKCEVYGNGGAGIASQQKGNLKAIQCEVHNNLEGILIQDTGRGKVEKCKSYSNRANGIFVGFDHVSSAVIIECEAYDNMSKGICIGNNKKVVVRSNIERGNRGLPPVITDNIKASLGQRVNKKHLKRMKKNRSGILDAMKSCKGTSLLDELFKSNSEHLHDVVVDTLSDAHKRCVYCKAVPSDGVVFSKCSRCKSVHYCSKICQKNDWEEHKKICRDKSIKYPSFVDKNTSV